MNSDGVGPLTFAVGLGIILILIVALNAVLTAFSQNAQKIGAAIGMPFTFPPPGSDQLFTQTSLMFYVLAAALFLVLAFTAWKSIREG
jgi:hypothetical protein